MQKRRKSNQKIQDVAEGWGEVNNKRSQANVVYSKPKPKQRRKVTTKKKNTPRNTKNQQNTNKKKKGEEPPTQNKRKNKVSSLQNPTKTAN